MSLPKPDAGYDQSLLHATQEVTRAERQEGYNVDLLNDDGHPPQRATTQRTALRQSIPATSAREDGTQRGKETFVPPLPQPVTVSTNRNAKVPWFRTTRGILTLAILAIVIVGAVVGGAVGGTVGHHKNNKASTTQHSAPASTTASTTGGVQGQAPTATTTPPASSSTTPSQGEASLSNADNISVSSATGASASGI
ncbi:hypothetical protein M422DRAFT_241348 [Sphaerobolus stellatus SS14]|nr:hypothetical protein M422DRAFT_241348 [Sphaerobolus stellatus SS14]